MNLHTDGYESVVYDFAVAKIGLIAFASFLDFMGERLQVTMAGLEIGFSGLGVGKSGHGVPFKQVIAPETAHFWSGQLLELSGWLRTEPEGPARPQKGCPQGLCRRKAAKPAKGLCDPCGLGHRVCSLLLSFL